jgi:hypothetical protein
MFYVCDTLNKFHQAYIYSCHHYSCFILFYFVEVECGLPLYFKCKSFQVIVDYPPSECVFEGVAHPPLVKILIYIFFWPCPFQEKKYFRPWKKYLLPLGICNRKTNLFVIPLHIYKETKH